MRSLLEDPIVKEIREIRNAYARKYDHDLDAICRDLQEKQQRGERRVVSRPPKRPQGTRAGQ